MKASERLRNFGPDNDIGELCGASYRCGTDLFVMSRCRPGLNLIPCRTHQEVAAVLAEIDAAGCGPGCRGSARHESVDIARYAGLPFRHKLRLMWWCFKRYEPDTTPRVRFQGAWLIGAMRAAGFQMAPSGLFRVRRRRPQ